MSFGAKQTGGFVVILLVVLVSAKAFYASSKYASLPHPPSQEIPSSYFGMHAHEMVVPNGSKPLTPWPSVKIPEWRLWDCRVTWPDLEPAKGQWRFETLDRSLEMAEEHSTGVILTLGLTPRWASARPDEPSGYQPGNAAEPKNIEDWRNFVQTVASRYRGRIHVYEIGNEPNLKQSWTGTTEQMIELTREAHDIIKSVDSTALIVSPSATNVYGVNWLADFLNRGGGQYVDVIGFHLYVTPHPPEAMVPLAQKVKQVMVEHGAGNKPLWNTESGWMPPVQFDSDEVKAAYLARAYTLLWAQDVERFYWYAWDEGHNGWLDLTEQDNRTPSPAGRAYGIIQEWLTGARMDYCYEENATWSCELNRGGSLEWIVWNPDQTRKYYVPPRWDVKHIVPLLGAERTLDGSYTEIGPEPVLFKP